MIHDSFHFIICLSSSTHIFSEWIQTLRVSSDSSLGCSWKHNGFAGPHTWPHTMRRQAPRSHVLPGNISPSNSQLITRNSSSTLNSSCSNKRSDLVSLKLRCSHKHALCIQVPRQEANYTSMNTWSKNTNAQTRTLMKSCGQSSRTIKSIYRASRSEWG